MRYLTIASIFFLLVYSINASEEIDSTKVKSNISDTSKVVLGEKSNLASDSNTTWYLVFIVFIMLLPFAMWWGLMKNIDQRVKEIAEETDEVESIGKILDFPPSENEILDKKDPPKAS